MRFFGETAHTIRYGAMIDIGSGSVLVAIVKSDSAKSYPEVLWAKRVYTPLRQGKNLEDSAKNVMVSLVTALMLLDSEGRKAFSDTTGKSKLPEAQVTIAAPWSYTITKNISYGHAENFTVSEELVEELLRTAHQKVEEDLKEHERINELGLSVITRSIIGLQANGYTLLNTHNQQAKSLRVIEASAIAQDYLIKALHDATEKVLPEAAVKLYSFILIYFYILRDLYPDLQEFCLIDITYEATEIGIVREGLLSYTTHTPTGAFTLARQIAEILDVPAEEAYGYLHNPDPLSLLLHYSEEKLTQVKQVLANYQKSLEELLEETGDSLAIPKKIYLHGNLETEKFFAEQVSNAAKAVTHSAHALYPISQRIISEHYNKESETALKKATNDTALLISAQFFHMVEYQNKFEHL